MKNASSEVPNLANITIADYWHAIVPTTAIKKAAKMHLQKHKRPMPQYSELEVVWMLKRPFFREILIVDGIAELSKFAVLKTEKSHGDTVHIVSDLLNSGLTTCILRLEIKERNGALHYRERKLPLSHVTKEHTLKVNHHPVFGGAIPFAFPDRCCGACLTVHEFLDIHGVDCWCCLGGCHFSCGGLTSE